ncbi:MAG: hypothetical protein LBO72_04190, partial [Helicobacteraceae bacterium]|nr:hypothetical protein [Helicobacteraceae bacterium]
GSVLSKPIDAIASSRSRSLNGIGFRAPSRLAKADEGFASGGQNAKAAFFALWRLNSALGS